MRLSGWAVAGSSVDAVNAWAEGTNATVSGPGEGAEGGLASQLTGLHGWDTASTSIAPGGTAYGPWAVVPELKGTARDRELYVAVASLSADPDSDAAPVGAVRVDVDGARVRITWPSDTPDTEIDLDALARKEFTA